MRRRKIVIFFFEVRGIVLACPISAKLPWAPKDLFCIRCTVITPNSRSPFWDSVALIRFQIHSSRYPQLRYFNGTIQLLGHVRGDASMRSAYLSLSHRNNPLMTQYLDHDPYMEFLLDCITDIRKVIISCTSR